jgi:hypothetical protein
MMMPITANRSPSHVRPFRKGEEEKKIEQRSPARSSTPAEQV